MKELEHQEQVALMHWAAFSMKTYPDLCMLYAIPNGGLRTKATAAKLKAEGVKAGVPDLFLSVPRGRYHGLYIEMKAGKNKPTQEQKEWIEQLNAQGYIACWCVGWESAAGLIKTYLQGQQIQTESNWRWSGCKFDRR